MGSGDWFKTIICRKKTKQVKMILEQDSNGSMKKNYSDKVSKALSNGNPKDSGLTVEEIAARRIQTAFRGYRARKTLRRLKGFRRLKVLSERHSIKKQTSTTLSYVQSWNRVQAEIRARRACMVTEGRIKQKKHENQLKLEAKLHGIEVDWNGGSDTMEEILSRIQQREEAAVKRERAMAYAFSHQWRASTGVGQLSYELGKGNWGWSWVERWVAARPWETRLTVQSTSPNKAQATPSSKNNKKPNLNGSSTPNSVKSTDNHRKGSTKVITHKPADNNDSTQESSTKQVLTSSRLKTKSKREQDLPTLTNGVAG